MLLLDCCVLQTGQTDMKGFIQWHRILNRIDRYIIRRAPCLPMHETRPNGLDRSLSWIWLIRYEGWEWLRGLRGWGGLRGTKRTEASWWGLWEAEVGCWWAHLPLYRWSDFLAGGGIPWGPCGPRNEGHLWNLKQNDDDDISAVGECLCVSMCGETL